MSGFAGLSVEKKHEVCADNNLKVQYVIEQVEKNTGMHIDRDEIMIMCNDRQLYIDENVPNECMEILIFPLALGG